MINSLSYRDVILYCIPLILSSLVEPLAGVVDTSFVGNINTIWLSALAVSVSLLSSFTWMFNFLVYASTQGISDSVGRRNKAQVNEKIKIALLLCLGLGAFAILLLFPFREQAYFLAGANEELVPIIDDYFVLRIFCHPIVLMFTCCVGIIRGLGKIKESFWATIINTGANIVLTWFFLKFTDLGLTGVALGTVLGNSIGLLYTLFIIIKSDFFSWELFKSKITSDTFLVFGKNSWNLFGRSFLLTTSFFLATKVSGEIGVYQLASHQILLQFWLFSAYLIDGVAHAGNILCARYKAQENHEKLKLITKRLFIIGIYVGVTFTAVYFFLNQSLWEIFSNDLIVFELIAQVWAVVWIGQVINAIAFVADGILFGLGAFAFLRKHMFIALVAIFFPILAYALLSQSLLLIWVAIFAVVIYRAISAGIYINSFFAKLD